MSQMSFFEMVGAKVLDAAEHEKNVQDNKRKNAKATNEKRKAADAALHELDRERELEVKPLAPTWELHFFDRDAAQRIAWCRAKDEDAAKVKVKKDYGKEAKVFYITQSKRTLEEIEALD